jgi:hypothetical protein
MRAFAITGPAPPDGHHRHWTRRPPAPTGRGPTPGAPIIWKGTD